MDLQTRIMGTVGIMIFLPLVVLVLTHPSNSQRWAAPADFAAHRGAYPVSSVPASGLDEVVCRSES